MTDRQYQPMSRLRRGAAVLRPLATPFLCVCMFVAGAMTERELGPAAQQLHPGPPVETQATAPHTAGRASASEDVSSLDSEIGRVRIALDEASRSLKEYQILLRVMEGADSAPTDLERRQLQLRVDELQRRITALQRRRVELMDLRSIWAARRDMDAIQQIGEDVRIEPAGSAAGDIGDAGLGPSAIRPTPVRWDIEGSPESKR